MNEKDFELFKSVDLKKDSKLSLYLDKKLNFHFEIKDLSTKSTYLFLYVILDNLINENIIDKKFLFDMINEIL